MSEPASAAPIVHAPAPAGNADQAQDNPTSSLEPVIDNSGPGVYQRIGYYDAASQTLENLVFLGNYGGETGGSGVFD